MNIKFFTTVWNSEPIHCSFCYLLRWYWTFRNNIFKWNIKMEQCFVRNFCPVCDKNWYIWKACWQKVWIRRQIGFRKFIGINQFITLWNTFRIVFQYALSPTIDFFSEFQFFPSQIESQMNYQKLSFSLYFYWIFLNFHLELNKLTFELEELIYKLFEFSLDIAPFHFSITHFHF